MAAAICQASAAAARELVLSQRRDGKRAAPSVVVRVGGGGRWRPACLGLSACAISLAPFSGTAGRWSSRTAAVVQQEPSGVLAEDDDEEDPSLAEFAENVSGEWDGYGADFDSRGEPKELPSQVVPEAFRDWGVRVYDWQTMCPTLGSPKAGLSYRVVRLLPTVGCEADAATTHSVQERDSSRSSMRAFHVKSGSYVAVWPGGGEGEFEVEHCLATGTGSDKSRARVLQRIAVDDVNSRVPVLKSITVYIEHYSGPFRNGQSLGGCSTTAAAFATSDRLRAADLVSHWDVDDLFGGPMPTEIERTQTEELIPLPSNLWSSVRPSGEASSVMEAGWMVNPNQSIVSSVEFASPGEFFQAPSIRIERRK